MPLSMLNYRSPLLGKCVQMTVLLPPGGEPPFATLYLLHGLSDDSTMWQRMTRLEDHLGNLPLAVVMPDGYRGWYTDNEAGPAYGQYIGEEVVAKAERYFALDARRERRGIGGLSMGGYGALLGALTYPRVFGSANSHSGALDIGRETAATRPGPVSEREFRQVFGEAPTGSKHDLLAVAAKCKAGGVVPKVRIDCGTEDFLLEANRRVHAALPFEHEYAEYPGSHTWAYWDEHVREALAFHARAMGIS